MARQLTAGEKAPDFELPEAFGGSVRLSELLKDHLAVLAFYSGDFGVICSLEMKQLQSMYADFRRAGAEIVGVATNSRFVHSAWRERLDLPFPLLSDFDGRVSDEYGVLMGEEGYLRGRSRRSMFIIDREGTLRYVWVSYDTSQAEEPDYDEVLKACQELGAVRERAPADRTLGSSTTSAF
jgi:peroxiredoxin